MAVNYLKRLYRTNRVQQVSVLSIMTTHVTGEDEHADIAPSTVATNQKTTKYAIFFSFWIAWGAWICNFDTAYTGTVMAMQPFNDAFGVCSMIPNPATGQMVKTCLLTATQQSLNTSIYTLFIALGGLVSTVTGRHLGRRGSIQAACLVVAIGAAGMLGTAGNFVGFVACKCIGGVGIGHLFAAAPMYGVECTPPQKRGMLLALFGMGLAAGSVVSGAVCLGSSKLTTNWAWQTPIICQIPLSVIYGFGILMFPESPRWLLLKAKEENARQSFGRFYGKHPSSPEIAEQVREVLTYIEFEKAISSTTAWHEIFHRSYIRRTVIAASTMIIISITGAQFVIPYTAIFLAQLGFTNKYLFNVVIGLCLFAGSILGPFLVEYAGRRATIIGGLTCMGLWMLIFSAVSSGLGSSNTAARNCLVAFLCLWGFTFSACIGSAAWPAATEVHSLRLRTYGHGFSIMLYQIVGFGATFWTPYMLSPSYGNMGTNVGYFYFGVTVFMLILMVLILPETARLKLEQIDDYFASGRPAWKTSILRNKKIAKNLICDISPDVRNATLTMNEK